MRSNRRFPGLFALALAGFIAGPAMAEPPGAPSVAVPVAALSPEAAALRDALTQAAAGLDVDERADVLAFYAARGYAPFWSESEPGRGDALLVALEGAQTHGLPLRRYDPTDLRARLAAGPADYEAVADAELRATRAYLRYARDLSSGLLTPSRVDPEINVTPPRPSRAELLDRIASRPTPEALATLAPASPEYAALLAEKARLAADAGAAWGPAVPAGGTLRLGDDGVRVAALRGRLALRGYAAPATATPAAFDAGLEAALERFQADSGLEPDGLAGRRTIEALNAGPGARLAQVLVNLERLRWMNRDLGPRYVWANIPDYSVKVVEDGATVFAARTVVGEAAKTRTPEFSEEMTYMVVNPTWHIPDSIAARVYLPKLRADPQVLAKNGMRLFTRSGTEINPGLVDFAGLEPGNFPFRIKQNPSDANALGRVKFMFPNQFAIYLHDTPNRGFFARQERALSNGCVRVENPLELAHILLQGQVDDPQAAFDGWLAAKSERTVMLKRPIPVHLVYRTVFVDDAGAIQYRFDVYGRDAEVFEALQAAGVTLPAAQG